MKTTYKKILNELMPRLQLLANMQSRGMVMLPNKVAYAIGKNLHQINPVMREFEKERHSIVEKTVNFEHGKPKILKGEKGERHFDWKEGGEDLYNQMIELLMDSEVEWESYRLPKDALGSIDNFPVEVYGTLEEFEMVTELHMAGPKLVN